MTWSHATAIASSAVVTLASCRIQIVRGDREPPQDCRKMVPGAGCGQHDKGQARCVTASAKNCLVPHTFRFLDSSRWAVEPGSEVMQQASPSSQPSVPGSGTPQFDRGRVTKLFTPRKCDRSVVRSSTEGHKLGQLYAERSSIAQTVRGVEQCAASTTAPLIRRRLCF